MSDTNQNKTGEAFKVTGDWSIQSKQLQDKFPELTDQDLAFEDGNEEEMIGKLETRLNMTREEVVDIINEGQSTAS
jgi:uncharacterized protein YjbJ (UPF0337 family)